MKDHPPDHPGPRLRELRVAAGMSQDELAELSDTRKSVISRIETGESVGRFETLQALAKALGVHISELFGANAPAPRSLDLACALDGRGQLTGPAVTRVLTPGVRLFVPEVKSIVVGESGPSWLAAVVTATAPLVATLDTTPRVAHDLRPGDVLVLRPLAADEELAPGRIVWATRGEEESELRVWRELDRRTWLWPFEGTGQRPETTDGWTVRAVVVEQRRQP